MAIKKDQAITAGEFFPPSNKNVIYHCYLNNTAGFLKDFVIFSFLIGIFAFLIIQFMGLVVVLLSWIIIVPWLLPKHYKFIQINKHILAFGTGSIPALIKSNFKIIYQIEKTRYIDLHYIKLDRWHTKKRGGKIDSFGRIEVKTDDIEPIFQILIHPSDLSRLLKTLESHRLHSKVQKSRSRDELLLLFPSSPYYSNPGRDP
ncbi:MAG: hypothetical protein JSW11_17555 [Candidatus Heimdallarchaeota archaeon]|nr:MAG: hypothetical protein JSW11_17555 [Candidatus Heimdallarchaeota archaeon]